MEDLFFFILCILSIINIKIKFFNNFFDDYMNLESTSSIKGIFVWMIILSHNKSYYKKNYKYLYIKILNCLKQKIVSLFFFYSGYGIIESIKKKGIKYPDTLPKKSIILFIKFQLILLIFILNNLFLGIKMNINKYLLSIIFKESIGNSNWFAYTIISFYFYSYLSFGLIKINNILFLELIIISLLCYFHGYFTYNFFYPKNLYAVDNILCFLLGIYYSNLKNKIDNLIMKNDIIYFGFLFLLILFYDYNNKRNKYVLNISIHNALFSLIIIILSMKIKFNNEFLKFLNIHSYSIYLLQRIIMIIIYYKNLFQQNEFIRLIFLFISIFFISCLFDKYTIYIDLYINKNINNKNKKINNIFLLHSEYVKIIS